MSSTECQTNPIDVNFQLQKSLEIVDKNSAAKNLIQKGQGVESTLPHARTYYGSCTYFRQNIN